MAEEKDTKLPNNGNEPEPEKDVVEVDKKTLKSILDTLEDLKNKDSQKDSIIKKLSEDNEKLLAISDKKRSADYDVRNTPNQLVKTVNVWTLDGKFITGWKMLTNKVIANLHRNVVETDQTIKVFYELEEGQKEEDQKFEILVYKTFIDTRTPVQGDVVKIESDVDDTFYTVEVEGGKKVRVNVNYIN